MLVIGRKPRRPFHVLMAGRLPGGVVDPDVTVGQAVQVSTPLSVPDRRRASGSPIPSDRHPAKWAASPSPPTWPAGVAELGGLHAIATETGNSVRF